MLARKRIEYVVFYDDSEYGIPKVGRGVNRIGYGAVAQSLLDRKATE